MKQLQPIIVGKYTVEIVAAKTHGGVLLTARCGDKIKTATMGIEANPATELHGALAAHERTSAHFEKDVQDLARRLAHEVAGHEHGDKLADEFLESFGPA